MVQAYGVKAIPSLRGNGEYFADAGWQDILIAFSLNIRQIQRIQTLAERVHLEVLVENTESVDALRQLSQAHLDAWIKVDVGNHRTGLDWTQTEVIAALAKGIQSLPNVQLRGLLTHSGNTYHCAGSSEIVRVFREGVQRLNALRDALRNLGITRLEISVGDTRVALFARIFLD
jgi:D-serine deaminase-like pyridoxal phosphate-dependent protein